MTPRRIFCLATLIPLIVLLFSAGWEFVIEDVLWPAFGGNYDEESLSHGLKFVITATGFAAVAVIIPTLLLLRSATERILAEQALRKSQARFEAISENAPLILWLSDREGRATFFNREWLSFTGRRSEEASGKVWLESLHPDDRDQALNQYLTAFRAREKFAMEYRLRRCDGEYRWMLERGIPRFASDGTFDGYVGFSMDITEHKRAQEQLDQANRKLSHLALYDALTGLANRRLFMDNLHQAIARAQRRNEPLTLLFIDLDGFKAVNDRLGHTAGDKLLQVVASRLKLNLRASDLIARLGGDEFTAIAENIHNDDAIEALAEKLIETIGEPAGIGLEKTVISASVGIAVYPEDGETPDALLNAADDAMYQAKQAGKNCFAFFRKRRRRKPLEQARGPRTARPSGQARRRAARGR